MSNEPIDLIPVIVERENVVLPDWCDSWGLARRLQAGDHRHQDRQLRHTHIRAERKPEMSAKPCIDVLAPLVDEAVMGDE